jgi:putative ABC transport system ATP-binding protein
MSGVASLKRAVTPAQESSPAVALRGVTKRFQSTGGDIWALRGVELTVPRGGVTMLVGPSGCGKTTLISVVAGILKRDSGTCRVLGEDVEAMSRRQQLDFRARHIGFIFQQFHLLPPLSAADNVAIPLIINGKPRSAALEAAHAMLEHVGLGGRGDDLPAVLSGGEQQRVAIARALVHGPDLVVCDEPTSALDHETGRKIMELMRSVVLEHGTTLLIVTHDNRIFSFADQMAHMDDGHIVTVTNGQQGSETS